jgi:hypothetical protein
VADPARLVCGPRAHGEVFVLPVSASSCSNKIWTQHTESNYCDRLWIMERPEITRTAPAFAHPAALAPSEASAVQRATSDTGRETVGKLMDDNSGLKISVPVGLT